MGLVPHFRCLSKNWFPYCFHAVGVVTVQIEENNSVIPLLQPWPGNKQRELWSDRPESTKRTVVDPELPLVQCARIEKSIFGFWDEHFGTVEAWAAACFRQETDL